MQHAVERRLASGPFSSRSLSVINNYHHAILTLPRPESGCTRQSSVNHPGFPSRVEIVVGRLSAHLTPRIGCNGFNASIRIPRRASIGECCDCCVTRSEIEVARRMLWACAFCGAQRRKRVHYM